MNKQKDRLVELVGCACREYFEYTAEMFAEGNYGIESMEEYVADYVLKRGALCPPCNVGDTAYFIIEDEIEGGKYITSQRINDVSTKGIFLSTSLTEENCNDFEPYSKLGKTVFLTKEEAEEALGKKLEKARERN